MKTRSIIITLAGIAALLSVKAGADTLVRMSPDAVKAMAVNTVNQYGLNADPCMLTAMAFVESGDVNNIPAGVNTLATRVETHISDVSTGMMQTLVSTAKWLAMDMGYTAFGIPTAQDLYDPQRSMYFAAAYVDWLSNYRGTPRNERWIVQSYNGGAGSDTGQTRNHYGKYMMAKGQLQQMGVCK